MCQTFYFLSLKFFHKIFEINLKLQQTIAYIKIIMIIYTRFQILKKKCFLKIIFHITLIMLQYNKID